MPPYLHLSQFYAHNLGILQARLRLNDCTQDTEKPEQPSSPPLPQVTQATDHCLPHTGKTGAALVYQEPVNSPIQPLRRSEVIVSCHERRPVPKFSHWGMQVPASWLNVQER